MLYITSRLDSRTEFDSDHDPDLWRKLVNGLGQINDNTWQFRIITDILHFDNEQYILHGSHEQWQKPEMVVQTALSYLRIVQTHPGTTFTMVSASESVLESHIALFENLYEQTTPANLESFLLNPQNQDLLIRSADIFDRETRNRRRETFAEKMKLGEFRKQYPLSKWTYFSLSIIPEINNPLNVSALRIKPRANQAWFAVVEDQTQYQDQYTQLARIDNLFELADITFRGDSLPIPALINQS